MILTPIEEQFLELCLWSLWRCSAGKVLAVQAQESEFIPRPHVNK